MAFSKASLYICEISRVGPLKSESTFSVSYQPHLNLTNMMVAGCACCRKHGLRGAQDKPLASCSMWGFEDEYCGEMS